MYLTTKKTKTTKTTFQVGPEGCGSPITLISVISMNDMYSFTDSYLMPIVSSFLKVHELWTAKQATVSCKPESELMSLWSWGGTSIKVYTYVFAPLIGDKGAEGVEQTLRFLALPGLVAGAPFSKLRRSMLPFGRTSDWARMAFGPADTACKTACQPRHPGTAGGKHGNWTSL